MKEFISESAIDTENFGARCAAKGNRVWALTGILGAGKTTFVKGFARGLGITDQIVSPTFVFFRVYRASKQVLYHGDMYRLATPGEAGAIGLSDALADPKGIVIIEWAERVRDLLPKETVWLTFTPQENGVVRIAISANS